jgi:hypothetical protein
MKKLESVETIPDVPLRLFYEGINCGEVSFQPFLTTNLKKS